MSFLLSWSTSLGHWYMCADKKASLFLRLSLGMSFQRCHPRPSSWIWYPTLRRVVGRDLHEEFRACLVPLQSGSTSAERSGALNFIVSAYLPIKLGLEGQMRFWADPCECDEQQSQRGSLCVLVSDRGWERRVGNLNRGNAGWEGVPGSNLIFKKLK